MNTKRWGQAALCLILTGALTGGVFWTAQKEEERIDDSYRCYYEIFTGSFYDSSGDGTGDLKGIQKKLDYVEELGFEGIWLTPIMPSPSYHKYDVTEYQAVDPSFGTMEDFTALAEECHKKGIRLILDLPFNHTSDRHPWFMEGCAYLEGLKEGETPDSSVCPYVDYYHFEREKEGIASWYPVGDSGWYYEGVFWSGMPDLALENSAVREEIKAAADFWLEKGADGFRLDAAKEYFTGETVKNTEVLKDFTEHVKLEKPDAYIVAEVWEGQSVLQEYYQSGIDSLFNFPASQQNGAIVKTAKGMAEPMEFFAWMKRQQEADRQANPAYIDAPFVSNHDTTRISAQCVNDEKTMKFAAGLLMMMPGSPFVYYGEELGMKSSGTKDENKRLPMFWSETEEEGIAAAPENADEVEQLFDAADVQMRDPSSVYHYYKEAIAVRKRHPEIARGTVEPVEGAFPEHTGAARFVWQEKQCVVVCSNGEESAEIDLRECLQEAYDYKIEDMLTVGEEKAALSEGMLTLPAQGIVVLGVD